MPSGGKEYELLFQFKAIMDGSFSSAFKDAGSQMGELSEAAQQLNQRISDIQSYQVAEQSIRELAEQSKQLIDAFNQTGQALERNREELSSSDTELKNLTTAEQNHQQAIKRLTEDLNEEKTELKEASDAAKTAENNVRSLSTQKSSLELKITGLNGKLETERQQLAQLDAAIQSGEGNTKKLTSEKEKLESTIRKDEAALEAERAKLDSVNTQLTEATAKEADAAQEKENHKNAVDKLQSALSEEKDKLSQTETAIKENESSTKELLNRKSELEQQLHKTAEAIDKNVASTREEEARMDQLGETLSRDGVNLQNLDAELEKCNQELQQQAEAAQKAYEELHKFDDLSESMENLAIGLSGVQVAAEAAYSAGKKMMSGFMDCVNAAAELEYEMSAVQAIAGLTDEEMDDVTATVQNLGATTIYTAAEVADAAEVAALAGWDYETMMAGLPAVTKLAAASGEELADVTSTVSDAVNAFGLSGSEAITEFSDTLVRAATSANTTIAQLSQALSYCEGTAANLGYSIQDVTVVLDIMANNSIKAGTAGSALNTMLTRMSGANSNAANQMDKLNLSMFETDGTAKDLLTFMEELRGAFQEFGDDAGAAQKAAYNLAGLRGMRGLLAVVNASDEAWEEMIEDVYDYAGATEEIANARLDNYTGQVELLSDAWTQLKVQIGSALLPTLTSAAGVLTNVITKINELISGSEEADTVIQGLAAGVGTFTVIAGGGTAAITVIQKLSTMLKSVSRALGTAAEQGSKFARVFENLGGFSGIAAKAGIASAAVAGLAAYISILSSEWKRHNEGANEAVEGYEALKKEAEETAEAFDTLMEASRNGETVDSYSFKESRDELKAELEEMEEYLEEIQAEYDQWYEETWNDTSMEGDFFGGLAALHAEKKYENTIEEQNNLIEEQKKKVAEASAAYIKAMLSEEDYTEIVNEMTDDQIDQIETLAEKTQDLGEAWEEAYTEALTGLQGVYSVFDRATNSTQENIMGTYSLLDRVTNDTVDSIMGTWSLLDKPEVTYSKSISDLTKNVTAQTKALTNYNNGLQTIINSGIEIPDNLWEELTDGSEDAIEKVYAFYTAITSGNTEALQAMISQYEAEEAQAERYAKLTETTVSDLRKNVQSQTAVFQEYNEQLGTLQEQGYDVLFSDFWSDLTDGSEDAREMVNALFTEIQEGDYDNLNGLIEDYRELYNATAETADFSKLSMQEVEDNLESQLAEWTEYQKNLQIILDSGIDTGGLWDSMTGGSEDARALAAAAAEDIEKNNGELLQSTVETYNQNAGIQSELAASWTNMDEDVRASIQDIQDTLSELGEGGDELYELAEEVTREAIQGYIDGLEDPDMQAALSGAIDSLMNIISGEGGGEIDFREAVNEACADVDTSVVYDTGMEAGHWWGQGMAAGVEESSGEPEDAIESANRSFIDVATAALGENSPSVIAEEQGVNYLLGFVNGINASIASVQAAMQNAANAAMTAFGNALSYQTFYNYGRNAIQGAIAGANSRKSSLISTYQNLATAASQAYASTLDIHSPSKVFEAYGSYTIEGAEIGAVEMADTLETAYQNLGALASDSYAEGAEPVDATAYSSVTNNSSQESQIIQLTYAPVIHTANGESTGDIKAQLAQHDAQLLNKLNDLLDRRERDNRRRVR